MNAPPAMVAPAPRRGRRADTSAAPPTVLYPVDMATPVHSPAYESAAARSASARSQRAARSRSPATTRAARSPSVSVRSPSAIPGLTTPAEPVPTAEPLPPGPAPVEQAAAIDHAARLLQQAQTIAAAVESMPAPAGWEGAEDEELIPDDVMQQRFAEAHARASARSKSRPARAPSKSARRSISKSPRTPQRSEHPEAAGSRDPVPPRVTPSPSGKVIFSPVPGARQTAFRRPLQTVISKAATKARTQTRETTGVSAPAAASRHRLAYKRTPAQKARDQQLTSISRKAERKAARTPGVTADEAKRVGAAARLEAKHTTAPPKPKTAAQPKPAPMRVAKPAAYAPGTGPAAVAKSKRTRRYSGNESQRPTKVRILDEDL
jgi:hypothetical protein